MIRSIVRACPLAFLTALAALTSSGAMATETEDPASNGLIAFTRGSDIWTASPDGTGESNLTNDAFFDGDPAWSPDGKKIAFRSNRGPRAIFVMDADGSNITQASHPTSEDDDLNPSWSPTGNALAFERDADGDEQVWTVNLLTSGEQVIPGSETLDENSSPVWSPFGDSIAFRGDCGGSCNIYTIPATGGTPTAATSGGGFIRADWSPDGQKLAFQRGSDIGVVTPGLATQVLTTGQHPTWSPDGTKILYTENLVLRTIPSEGGSSESLDVQGSEPSWGTFVPPLEVEFTQAIQQRQTLNGLQADLEGDGQPPVPIIAGKPAVMRLYFTEVDETTQFTVEVSGTVNSTKQLTLTPGCTAEDRRKQEAGCRSVDFYFTPPEGDWSVDLDVHKTGGETVVDEEFELRSVRTSPLNIVAVPVCDGGGCGLASDLAQAIGLLRKTYPGAVNVTFAVGGNVTRPTTNSDGAWWSSVLADLNAIRAADGAAEGTYYHGSVRTAAGGFAGFGILGMGYRPGTAGATRLGATATDISGSPGASTEQVVAHEVGHNLGRQHVPTVPGTTCYGTPTGLDPDWPHPNPRIHEVGFDVATGRAKKADAFTDIMAYCLPGWISVYNYTQIMNLFTISSAAVPQGQAAGDFWQVSGSIDEATASFDPIFAVETTAPTGPGTGAYRIEVRDGEGGLLFTRMFEAQNAHWPGLASVNAFFQMIPVQPGAALISIFDPLNSLLGSLELDGEAPVVEVGDVIADGQDYTFSWSVTDPDSTGHSFRLDFSADGGASWNSLVPHIEETTVTVGDLPASEQAVVRVSASDGVNTGSAISAPFVTAPHLPEAEIISPSGSRFTRGQLVLLGAVALDADDGGLNGPAVTWSSNRDGSLGSGAYLSVYDLSVGTHTITMTARDSDYNAVTDTTNVTISDLPIVEGEGPSDDRVWGDNDCDGEITSRDNQALSRKVLQQPALSQTQPCPALSDGVGVGGASLAWGDLDCDGEITSRDGQALLRKVLAQNPLSQTQPCPVIGDIVAVSASALFAPSWWPENWRHS